MEIKAKATTILDEFKNFALKGNVIDLAVGVIIGASFGKIVDALVKNILMPIVAIVMPGEQGYAGWGITINGSRIQFGAFLAEVINFLIVAAALFLIMVKFLGWLTRKKEEKKLEAPPPLTKDQELLIEIRDLLAATNNRPVSASVPNLTSTHA